MRFKDNVFDVVVVGAGIVGHSVAVALAERGLLVALVDARGAGQGTSSSSFNWINATSKVNDRTYFDLNATGLLRYQRLGETWGDQRVGLHRNGMIEWAHPGSPQRLEDIRRAAARLLEWGYPVTWLDSQQLEEAEPHIRFEQDAEGYLAPDDCWLEVPQYLSFMRTRLERLGSVVKDECPAVELNASDDGVVRGIETAFGRLVCKDVVICVGPDTPDVLSKLTGHEGFASRFPIQKGPGLLLTTPVDHFEKIRHIVYTSDPSGLHIRDNGNGRLLAGSDDTDGQVSGPMEESGIRVAVQTLLERVHDYVSTSKRTNIERCHWSIGIRAVPIDGRSIAGPVLGAEGLHMIVTHSGITLAPALAELVADSVALGRIPDRLKPYLLDRFDSAV